MSVFLTVHKPAEDGRRLSQPHEAECSVPHSGTGAKSWRPGFQPQCLLSLSGGHSSNVKPLSKSQAPWTNDSPHTTMRTWDKLSFGVGVKQVLSRCELAFNTAVCLCMGNEWEPQLTQAPIIRGL